MNDSKDPKDQDDNVHEFERFLSRHRPADGDYYFLIRYTKDGKTEREPTEGTWRARQPCDTPLAGAGPWLVFYTKDREGRERVPPVGHQGPLRFVLRWNLDAHRTEPGEAKSDEKTAAADAELIKTLVNGLGEDDAEGSLKAARIEAKRRDLALELKAKEHELLRNVSINKELAEAFILNRSLRLELQAQSEHVTRIQRQGTESLERQFFLFQQMQESAGRQAEREREASLRAASPPPPPDYTPVYQSAIGMLRDISVTALQRDNPPRPALEGQVQRAVLAGPSPSPEEALQQESATAASSRPTEAQLRADVERLRVELAAAKARAALLQEATASAEAERKTASPPPPSVEAAPPVPRSVPNPAASIVAAAPPESITKKQSSDSMQPAKRNPPTQEGSPEPTAAHVSAVPTTLGADPPDSAVAAPTMSASIEPKGATVPITSSVQVIQSAPTGKDVSTDVLGILVNMHAGELLAETDTPTGRPLVRPVTPIDPIERVLIDPPKMDRETALRLIQEGTAVESLGALLIFNPMLRDELLRLKRK